MDLMDLMNRLILVDPMDLMDLLHRHFLLDQMDRLNRHYLPDQMDRLNRHYLPDQMDLIHRLNRHYLPDQMDRMALMDIADILMSTSTVDMVDILMCKIVLMDPMDSIRRLNIVYSYNYNY
jgi:hypothetical protein